MARKRTGLNACGGYKYNGNTYTAQELFNLLKDGELENLVKDGKITINPEDMPLLSKKFESVAAASTKQPVQPMANTGFQQGDEVYFRYRGKGQTVQAKAKIEQIIEKDGVPAFVKIEGINKQIPIVDISAKPFGGVEEAKKAAEAKAEKTPMSKFEKAKEKGFALVDAINKTKAKVYSFVDEKVLERSGWTKKSVTDFQKAFNSAFNSTELGKKKLGKDVQIILMSNSQMLDWTAANQPEAYKAAVAGKLGIKGVLVSADGSVVIINVDKASNTTPLHEIAGHIWESWAKKNAPVLYNAMTKKVSETKFFAMLSKAQDMIAEGKSIAQVMQSLKNTKDFKAVFADKKSTEAFLDLMQYVSHGLNSNLSRESIDSILRSEIFAKVIETNAEILGAHEDKSVIQSFKDFIVELFKKLQDITGFKKLNYKALSEMDINQFAQTVLSELATSNLSTDIARNIRVAEAGFAEEATESQIIPEANKRGQNITEEDEFEVNETTAEEENKGIDESEQEEVQEVTIDDVMNQIAESDEPNIYATMDVAEAAKQAIGNIPYIKTLFQYATRTLLKSKDEAKRAEAAELMDNPKVFLNSRLEDLKAAEQTEETVKEIAEIEAAIAEIDRINALVEGANKVLTTFGTDGDVVSDVSAYSFIRSTPEAILKPLLELVTSTQFFQDAKKVDPSTNPADILEGILTQRYTLSKEDRAIMGSILEGPLKKFWDFHTDKLRAEDEFITSAKLQELFKKEYNKSVKGNALKETKRKIKSVKIKINKQTKSIFAKVKALETQLGTMTDPEAKARVRAEINSMLHKITKNAVANKELDNLAYNSFFYEDMNNAFGLEEFGEEGFYRLLGAMPYVRGKYVDTTGIATSYKETSKSGDIVGDNEVITSHVLKSENGNILASFEITKNYDTNQGHISFIESDKMFGDPEATKEAFIAATRMLQMEGLTPVIDQYMNGQTYDMLKTYAGEGLLVENKLAPKEEPFGPQDEVRFYGIPPFQYNFDGVLSVKPQEATPRQLSLFQFGAKHGTHTLFNKFDSNFIGTGEGAQAFGWGLYFSDLDEIAEDYARQVSKNKGKDIYEINEKPVSKELANGLNYFFQFVSKKLNVISSRKELSEELYTAWEKIAKHLSKDWKLIHDAENEYRPKILKFLKDHNLSWKKELIKLVNPYNLDYEEIFSGDKDEAKQRLLEGFISINALLLKNNEAIRKPENMSDEDFFEAKIALDKFYNKNKLPIRQGWGRGGGKLDLIEWKRFSGIDNTKLVNDVASIIKENSLIDKKTADLINDYVDFVFDNYKPLYDKISNVNLNSFNEIAGFSMPMASVGEFDPIKGEFGTELLDNATREIKLDEATDLIKETISNLSSLDIDKSKPFSIKKFKNEGVVYQVTIHKGKTPDQYDYINWDKPLSENQIEKIKKEFNNLPDAKNILDLNPKLSLALRSPKYVSASSIYDFLKQAFKSHKKASLFLLDAGIDGIKYPVNYTTNPREADFNYVVFDDNAVTIEEARDLDKNPLFSFSTNNLEDDFYYPLEKRLTEMKDEVKTAKQWKDLLKGGDEVYFSGLTDYLNVFKPDEKVSKEDILSFFNDYKPKFKVSTYSDDAAPEEAEKQYTKINKEYRNEISNFILQFLQLGEYNPEDIETLDDVYFEIQNDLIKIEADYIDKLRNIGYEDVGLEDEDEYLYRLSELDKQLGGLENIFYSNPNSLRNLARKTSLGAYSSTPGQPTSSEQFKVFGQLYNLNIQGGESSNYTITNVSLKGNELYKSSHFNESNTIVHVRTTVRKTVAGEKVLFLEEVQSDWGQEGRREGYFNTPKGKVNLEKKLKRQEKERADKKEELAKSTELNIKYFKKLYPILDDVFKLFYEEYKDILPSTRVSFEPITNKIIDFKYSEYGFKEISDAVKNIIAEMGLPGTSEIETELYSKYQKLDKKFKTLTNKHLKELNSISDYYSGLNDKIDLNNYLDSLQSMKFNYRDGYLKGIDNIENIKTLLEDKSSPRNNLLISILSDFQMMEDFFTPMSDETIDTLPEQVKYESAPFVEETSDWAKLGIKITLQQAVKNGCTRIAWTTGEQQDITNGKQEPTYHKFYGSPKLKELGTVGNIFKKITNLPDEKIELVKIDFGKEKGKKVINDVYSLSIDNNTVEKVYAGMPMFSLGAPQTNAAIAPTSQTNGVNNTLTQTGVTPNAGQQAPLNAQQQGHINNIANSYRNLNPYTQIQFQQFQPENKSILAQANRALTRQTVASLGLGTEYTLAKESMVGYEANQKSELQKESQAALKLLTSEKYQNDPSLKGTTIEAKMNLIQLALSGDPVAFNVLPVDFQPTITAMRNRIDSLSEAMIRSGWLKLNTAEAFANGMGNYLRRQYKKFTLKEKAWEKYANNLDPQVRDKAIEGFYTWVSEGFYTEPQTMANQPGFVPLYQRWRTYNSESKQATKLETRLNALESRLNLKQQQLPQRQNQQTAQNTIAKLQKDIADVKAELNPLQAKLAADFPLLDANTYDLAEKGLQDLLDAPEVSSSLNPYTGSQIQMATLKKRLGDKELPGWMRDVMGEIKDPVMNYQMTVSNLVNMTSRLKFLNDVYTLAKRDGFIYNDIQLSAKEREQLKKEGWVNVDGTNEGTPQTRFGPFIGTWIKPELYDFAFGTDAEISAIYSIRGWVLIGKTAGNVLFGPIRNFFGNGSFLLVNGSATKFFANLKNGVSKSDYDYMKSLPGKNLGSKFYNFWDSAIDDAEKLGLFQTVNTEWAKETFGKISKDTVLMKAFERSEAEGWAYFYKNYVVNLAKWIKDGAVQSYIWADILPKLTSFTTSRNHLANKLAIAAGLPSGLSYNTLANPSQSHPLYSKIKAAIKPEQLEAINQMAGHQTNLSMVTSNRVAPIVANMPKKTKYKGKSAAGIGAAATKDALTLVFGGDFPRFVAESMRIFLQQLANVATVNKTYEQNVFKVFDDKKANDEFLTSLNREQRAHTLAGLISWSGVMSQIVPYFGSLGSALLAMAGLGGGDDDDDQPEVDNNKSAQVSTKPGFTTEGFMNKNRNLGAEMYRLYQAKINGGMSIDEALREVSREFEQNHQLDFKLLGEGKFMRQDVSSIDPFTVFTAIPRSLLYRPERGFYNKLTGNVSSLYEEYLGVEMGVSTAMDLIKNENPYTGLPIYNEQADFVGKKGAAMLYHGIQTLAPTFITKALKMYEKSKDKVNQRTGEVTEGKPLDKQMLVELQSAAYGRTYYEENPRKLLYNLIKPLYAGKAGAVRQKTYFKDLNILKDVCYRMNRKVQAMRTLGMKEEEIAEVVGDVIREDSIWEAVYYGGQYIDNLQIDEENN